jgi:alpha-tubulin suppressor-like RCC1 family protein
LRNDGIVSCWGENDRGQLGSPSLDAALTVVVESLGPVKYMASGSDHSCAIIAKDGSLWCWGDNAYGQLGQGKTDTQVHAQPIRVPGLPPCVQVEAGDKTTFVRTDDDRIFGWGFGIKRPVPIDVQGVKKVATGGKQNCALVDGGRVWCWGFNDFGQLGDQSSEDSAIPRLMTSLFKVNDLAVGNVHICALIEGEVWCWGSNEYGQLGQGSKDRSRHPEPHRVMTGGCP